MGACGRVRIGLGCPKPQDNVLTCVLPFSSLNFQPVLRGLVNCRKVISACFVPGSVCHRTWPGKTP